MADDKTKNEPSQKSGEASPEGINALRQSQSARLLNKAGKPIRTRTRGDTTRTEEVLGTSVDPQTTDAMPIGAVPSETARPRILLPEAWIAVAAALIVFVLATILLQRLGGGLAGGSTPYVLAGSGCAIFLLLVSLEIARVRRGGR